MVQACGGVSAPERRPPAPADPPARTAAEPGERPQLVFFDSEDYAGATVEGWAGSRACAECHEAEFAHWLRTPHARAWADAKNSMEDPPLRCRRCHASLLVSPETDAERLDLDLAGVGCESCHGPGGEHVPEDAVKRGSIVSLTDKCDSCVILQICGSCHDDANDPRFKFEVEQRIDDQRHGTIESAATRAVPSMKGAAWSR